MKKAQSLSVDSETGILEKVIIHTPGKEVENMTPDDAERALYSDILNLSVARQEYGQFREVLKGFCQVYELRDILADVLEKEEVRRKLVQHACSGSLNHEEQCSLMDLSTGELTRQLIEGVELRRDNLTRFLSPKRFALEPLHNFFFIRDASIRIGNSILVASMANPVRERETLIMEAIFSAHGELNSETFRLSEPRGISIEGGDVLVAREDILLIGIGSRTSSSAVDALVEHYKKKGVKKHIIVQEIPEKGESFIHLDMVFTLLSGEECMIYSPVILSGRYRTIHIRLDGRRVTIREEDNIPSLLGRLGMSLKTISCGGDKNPMVQEREQWHSGANFLAVAPGKVIGYSRNVYTMEALSQQGYDILRARDIIRGKADPSTSRKCVIGIDGAELARGGGGARCMSLPVSRKS